MLMCKDCKWDVAVYKREYKGVVLGCNNPKPDKLAGHGCFVSKKKTIKEDEQ